MLLAWITAAALAVPRRDDRHRLPDRTAPAGPAPRFIIRHSQNGPAGALATPDGRLTLKVTGALKARLVVAQSGKTVGPELRHSRRRDGMRLHAWAFSPDGRLLATASSEGEGEDTVGEVRVWEVASGKLLATATDGSYELGRVHTVAFSEDGADVVIHCQDISGK
jgi:hypothetical protein